MKKTIAAVIGLLLVSAVMISVAFRIGESKQFSYKDHLKDTVFELDGEKYTLEQMNYYIAVQEREVEQQAQVYNPENTVQYWNIHTNRQYIRKTSKEAVLDTAIHHMLLSREAQENGIELTKDEEELAQSNASDLSYDLEDWQKERAGITEEELCVMARKTVLAEKYQRILAEENQKNYGSYDYSGKSYKKMLKKHDLVIHDKLWDEVLIGEVTLDHYGKN